MAFTAKEVAAIKEAGKYFDGAGMYLLITKTGARGWRLKYRISGKEKLASLGVYPDVSLAEARIRRTKYRDIIKDGIDPLQIKREKKTKVLAIEASKVNTFKVVAEVYFGWIKKQGQMQESTLHKLKLAFKKDAFPKIGKVPMTDVTAEQLEDILIGMDDRGAVTSAHRFHTQLTNMFDWARSGKNRFLPKNEPTQISMVHKKYILSKKVEVHFEIIEDEKILGQLLRDLDTAPCEYPTRQALKVAPHLGARPANLRYMTWDEVDLDKKLWTIPASKMKRKVKHIVPLSDYVVQVIKETHDQWSHDKKYVFASHRTQRELSISTLGGGIHRILDDDEKQKYTITPHGFRGTFATLTREKGDFDDRHIEAQLAHGLSDTTEAAYNRANYVEPRRKMMQWWSDYLLGLKNA